MSGRTKRGGTFFQGPTSVIKEETLTSEELLDDSAPPTARTSNLGMCHCFLENKGRSSRPTDAHGDAVLPGHAQFGAL